MFARKDNQWSFAVPDATPRRALVVLPPAPPRVDVEKLALTCLNCGRGMHEVKCRLVCECGYYMSCADFI